MTSEGSGTKKPKYETQYLNVVFTAWQEPVIDKSLATFYIYQWEKGGNTNRPHVQGYIEFKKRLRLAQVKKAINPNDNTTHIELRMGTAEQAIAYCQKEETRMMEHPIQRWGEPRPMQQGKRNDLEFQDVLDAIRGGMTLEEIRIAFVTTYIKAGRWVQEVYADFHRNKCQAYRDIETVVYWGPTQFGKTRRVLHEYPGAYKLDMSGDKVWFDGYDPANPDHSVLLIDDFYGEQSQVSITALLNWTHGYKLRLNVKNSFTYAAWTKVFITSNTDWKNWYPTLTANTKAALARRLTSVIHVTTEWIPPVAAATTTTTDGGGDAVDVSTGEVNDSSLLEIDRLQGGAVLDLGEGVL